MLYIGIDIHKKNLQICLMGEDGEGARNCKVRNDKDSIVGFLSGQRLPAKVAMEPTHNWGALYDLLDWLGYEVHVAHPRDVELIGKSRVSTDKKSAYKLAALLRAGFLPEAYVPNSQGRELRRLIRGRAGLTATATQVKNQVQAALREKWVSHKFSDLFGVGGRRFLEHLDLGPISNLLMMARLKLLDEINHKIALLNDKIHEHAYRDKRAVLLMTIKGIGEYSAVLILSEIVDIRRFGRAESLVRYAGLNPSESSSGETVRRGRIEKAGSRWLRWILVEAANHAIREEGKVRDLYLRVLERRGHNFAIVAAARELLVSIYWMLTRMEPYRPSGRSKASMATGEVK